MSTWVTHLMIADRVMPEIPGLKRREFCVGNIAPDCNVENDDWTQFVPSREVTHWMSGGRKVSADCDRFYSEYIEKRKHNINSPEEYSFLLGYYAHLIADAEFQRFIRDEKRVADVWKRIKDHPELAEKAAGMPENWDSVKVLIGKADRMKDIYSIEAEYLEANSISGYFSEIIGLKHFPDYIDYLPKGAIVRKIGVMGHIPQKELSLYPYIAITKEEYAMFIESAAELVIKSINKIMD